MYTIEQGNKEIKKVISYLEEINEVYNEPMNLKLHDVNYYIWDKMETDFPLCYEDNNKTLYGNDYFSFFCEDSYNMFLEWCNEECIDFEKMINRIGRTSSFYLTDIHDVSIEYIIYNLLDNLYGGYYICEFTENGMDISDNETLEYICNDFYNDVKEYFKNAVKVYNYIKDTKENQVKYFKEFLEYYEMELESEELKEKEEISRFNNDIETIIKDLKKAEVDFLNEKIDFLNSFKK